jgi:hypothetical protein
MVLPNGIIAGVNKAGTTAIFNALALQANVAVSRNKETHFFSPLEFGEPHPPLAEYAAQFPAQTTADAVIEGTPSYFYGGERMARGIEAAVPGVRILVVLREPGARAFSLWRFSRSRLRIPSNLSFRAYLEQCRELGDRPQTEPGLTGWRALSGGRYSQYLPAWQEVFGSRLMVAFHDDVGSDFDGSMQRICAHFGAAWSPATQPVKEHNVTTDVKSAALQRMALWLNETAEEVWRRSPRMKAALRSGYYRLNAKKVQQERMSAEDRAWLDDYFQPELDRLRQQTAGVSHRPAWLAPDRATAEAPRKTERTAAAGGLDAEAALR